MAKQWWEALKEGCSIKEEVDAVKEGTEGKLGCEAREEKDFDDEDDESEYKFLGFDWSESCSWFGWQGRGHGRSPILCGYREERGREREKRRIV